MDFLPFKALQRVECLFLKNEKTSFTLNSFFIIVPLFDAEGFAHDSEEGVVKILGRQGADECFTFELYVSLDEEGHGKVNK